LGNYLKFNLNVSLAKQTAFFKFMTSIQTILFVPNVKEGIKSRLIYVSKYKKLISAIYI